MYLQKVPNSHLITATLDSGMQITMHRQDIVVQLEAYGIEPKEAFEIVCDTEDAYPLALRINTTKE